MIRVQFQPFVTVTLDGGIDVDWSDSEIGAVDSDGNEVESPTDEKGYSVGAARLDAILGDGARLDATPAQQAAALRRLADAIEEGA